MKKILVVVGSARVGSSLYIGTTTKKVLEESGCQANLVKLSDYKVEYCDGCLFCDNHGYCHKKDDMENLLNLVKEANGVVFISPTRWSLLSGDMKTFMDRWNPLAGKNLFDNKFSYVVAIGQTSIEESESIKKALTSLKYFSDDAGFNLQGEFIFENCYAPEDISKQDEKLSEYINEMKKFALKVLEV